MRKTMVYLEDEQHARLKGLAQRQGTSMADVLRHALDIYLDREAENSDHFGFVGAGAGEKGGRASERVRESIRKVMKHRTR